MDWIIEELGALSFGDERLKKRAIKVLSQLSHNATDSIPAPDFRTFCISNS